MGTLPQPIRDVFRALVVVNLKHTQIAVPNGAGQLEDVQALGKPGDGFAGGLWAVSYEKPPIPLARRLTWTCGSAIVAGYLTPPAVAMLLPSLPGRMTAELIQHGAAFLIGFTAFSRLGPALLSLAGKIISRMEK